MPGPDAAAIKSYLGSDSSWDDDEIASALAAEASAQRRCCRIPLARTESVSTTLGSAVVTAAADTFTEGDLEAGVSGTGIPVNATILSVDSDTQVTLSANAMATGTTVTLTIDPDRVDLDEALKRRVARNLAMRNLPLGAQPTISEAGVGTFRPGLDLEIRRLEGPFRKLRVG